MSKLIFPLLAILFLKSNYLAAEDFVFDNYCSDSGFITCCAGPNGGYRSNWGRNTANILCGNAYPNLNDTAFIPHGLYVDNCSSTGSYNSNAILLSLNIEGEAACNTRSAPRSIRIEEGGALYPQSLKHDVSNQIMYIQNYGTMSANPPEISWLSIGTQSKTVRDVIDNYGEILANGSLFHFFNTELNNHSDSVIEIGPSNSSSFFDADSSLNNFGTIIVNNSNTNSKHSIYGFVEDQGGQYNILSGELEINPSQQQVYNNTYIDVHNNGRLRLARSNNNISIAAEFYASAIDGSSGSTIYLGNGITLKDNSVLTNHGITECLNSSFKGIDSTLDLNTLQAPSSINFRVIDWTRGNIYLRGPSNFRCFNKIQGTQFQVDDTLSIDGYIGGPIQLKDSTIDGAGTVIFNGQFTLDNNTINTKTKFGEWVGTGANIKLINALNLNNPGNGSDENSWSNFEKGVIANETAAGSVLKLDGYHKFLGESGLFSINGVNIVNNGNLAIEKSGFSFRDIHDELLSFVNNNQIFISGIGFSADSSSSDSESMSLVNYGIIQVHSENPTTLTNLNGVELINASQLAITRGDLSASKILNLDGATIEATGNAILGGVVFASDPISSIIRNYIYARLKSVVTGDATELRGWRRIQGFKYFEKGFWTVTPYSQLVSEYFIDLINDTYFGRDFNYEMYIGGNNGERITKLRQSQGKLSLGGTLQITKDADFNISNETAITIIESSSGLVGNFHDVVGASLPNGQALFLDRQPNSLRLLAATPIELIPERDHLGISEGEKTIAFMARTKNTDLTLPLLKDVQIQSLSPSILRVTENNKLKGLRTGVAPLKLIYNNKQYLTFINVELTPRQNSLQIISKSQTDDLFYGDSRNSQLSENGRFLVYQTNAPLDIYNEFEDDNKSDIVRVDLATKDSKLVSTDLFGKDVGFENISPVVSNDGIWVAYKTDDRSLFGYTSGISRLGALKNINTGQVINFDKDISNNRPSSSLTIESPIAISGDGRFVAFMSAANDLVSNDFNDSIVDIFVYDRILNQTTKITKSHNSLALSHSVEHFSMTSNGRFILFETRANNVVSFDTNGKNDLFLIDRDPNNDGNFDLSEATVEIITLASNGNLLSDQTSAKGTITADGKFVVFHSNSAQLVLNDNNGKYDIFIKNRETNFIEKVSKANNGDSLAGDSYYPMISRHGDFISFYSNGNITDDNYNKYQVYLYDTKTRQTKLVTNSVVKGSGGNMNSSIGKFSRISSDGCTLVFESEATNLVYNDHNGSSDIFLMERAQWQNFNSSSMIRSCPQNKSILSEVDAVEEFPVVTTSTK